MQQLKLFDKLPESFFSILSSPNKIIYTECIFILYQQFKKSWSFGIPKDLAQGSIMDYLDQLDNMGQLVELEGEILNSSRDKTNAIIRKLKECKWIDIETDNSYNETIIITDHGILFLELFNNIRMDKKLEYQSKINSIYLQLFSENTMKINLILRQVHDDTITLMTSLKSLNSNIKKYIQKTTEQSSSEQILDSLFNEYALEILDKAYHRLKTSDNVSRYRPLILRRIESICANKQLLEEAYQLELDMNNARTKVEAQDNIWLALKEIMDSFRHMDDLIKEIDRRNSIYIRAAYNRVRYLINTQSNIEGNIEEILKYLVKQKRVNSDNHLEEIQDELFKVFKQFMIDDTSLYTRKNKRRKFEAQKLSKNIISDEEKARLRKIRTKKREKKHNKKNINQYVNQLIGTKKELNVKEINIITDEEYVNLIYIKIFSKSPIMDYCIERKDEVITKNGYTFSNFIIRRK